jgi:uncharacterized membrane protein
LSRSSPGARLRLGAFWIFAGSMHFVIPRTYEAIMPSYLGRCKKELVAASGAAEIAGGLAVLPARTRRAGRWWLLATLAAIFPANVNMAVNAQDFRRIPEPLLWARLPFQGVFAWFIWRGTR